MLFLPMRTQDSYIRHVLDLKILNCLFTVKDYTIGFWTYTFTILAYKKFTLIRLKAEREKNIKEKIPCPPRRLDRL